MNPERKPSETLDGHQHHPLANGPKPSRWPWLLALLVVLGIGAGVTYWLFSGGKPAPEAPAAASREKQPADAKAQDAKAPTASIPPSKTGDTVDLAKLAPKADAAQPGQAPTAAAGQVHPQAAEQAQRKQSLGLDKSLDAVLRSDEKIKMAGKTVTITELERKLVVESRGEVMEKPLGGKKKNITAWGVHVVRPNENLWEIHFRLLREYMASRGVTLARNADKPLATGKSSGVGKVLKFAEHMVGVFNLQTGHMSKNLDKLEPGAKLVVFNLSEIFAELSKINPEDLSGIMYDGRVLLLPRTNGGAKAVKAPKE